MKFSDLQRAKQRQTRRRARPDPDVLAAEPARFAALSPAAGPAGTPDGPATAAAPVPVRYAGGLSGLPRAWPPG